VLSNKGVIIVCLRACVDNRGWKLTTSNFPPPSVPPSSAFSTRTPHSSSWPCCPPCCEKKRDGWENWVLVLRWRRGCGFIEVGEEPRSNKAGWFVACIVVREDQSILRRIFAFHFCFIFPRIIYCRWTRLGRGRVQLRNFPSKITAGWHSEYCKVWATLHFPHVETYTRG